MIRSSRRCQIGTSKIIKDDAVSVSLGGSMENVIETFKNSKNFLILRKMNIYILSRAARIVVS